MKSALVTGAAGFVGRHLSNHLSSQGIQVTGLIHPNHENPGQKLLDRKIKIEKCDILEKQKVENFLNKNKFDYVFHLAAFSSPSQSFKNPKETLQNNIFGQLFLLENLSKNSPKTRILIVGSGDEYGHVNEKDLPIVEETPLLPVSPYAVSKVAQDYLGLQYFLRQKLSVIRVRPFNHIGPGQSPVFVVPAFAKQIAAIEKKGGGTVNVGNLNAWRDFTDVRDVVRAYLLALEKGEPGQVYNIGSGKARKIADILKELISFSSSKIIVKEDSTLVRKSDNAKIYCSFEKFKKQTGWEPKITISRTLFDTIEYERKLLN